MASALIFTILHLFNSKVEVIAVMNIFCGGWVLGLLYVQNKTIVGPIGFHLGWNLTQAIVGSPVSGESNFNSSDYMTDLFSGNSFGLESSITCLLLLVIYLLFFIRKHVILQKN